MSALKPGCTARVLDVPGSEHFAGRLVEVKTIAQEHDCKRFSGEGAYAWAPGFGWWFPVECLEWVSDTAPVWPPRYDEDKDEDGCEDCEDLCAEIAALTAENARLSRLNGRRERHILRARLQEAGAPVTPEWIDGIERIWPEDLMLQRLCSALRRAWDERDRARAIIAEILADDPGAEGVYTRASEALDA